MISDAPKAFVEKADSDVIRVKIMDKNIEGELKALGFNTADESIVVERVVADDSEKAALFDALRSIGVLFSGGKEWCPAEVFEYLRDKGLVNGKFAKICWVDTGVYRVESAR